MAEQKGFEPLLALTPLTVFETALFNHLSIAPCLILYRIRLRKSIFKVKNT